jgi:hypothetical protein
MIKIILYIIEGNITGKRYVGITNNLQRRLIDYIDIKAKNKKIICVIVLKNRRVPAASVCLVKCFAISRGEAKQQR